MRILRAVLLAGLGLASAGLGAEQYDLIIRGGRVIDGTGNPAFFADLAIANGRIAALGKIRGAALAFTPSSIPLTRFCWKQSMSQTRRLI